MPVARYFLFVGGVLLALLLVIDAYVPQRAAVASNDPSVHQSSRHKSIVRIHSDQKWPERVVYDTSLPTIVPPNPTVQAAVEPAPAPVVDLSAQSRVRDTFAQFVPSEPRQAQPQAPKKRKIARTRSISPSPVRVAQQSQFGFFGNGSW